MTSSTQQISEASLDTPANLRLFEHLYRLLLPWIVTRARRLSQGDRDLQDDLLQIGLQTLWERCAPTVTPLDPAVVRAYAYRAMIAYRRAERRAGVIQIAPGRARVHAARAVRYVPSRPASAAACARCTVTDGHR